jgi:hypothetical protein
MSNDGHSVWLYVQTATYEPRWWCIFSTYVGGNVGTRVRVIEDHTRVIGVVPGTPADTGTMGRTHIDPEAVAEYFHTTYERLAPDFGYRTREESAKPWAQVPERNKALMVAVAGEVLTWLTRGGRDGARRIVRESEHVEEER